jgi:uncharacterized lipoprotein YddW (UPF0748 family)
MQILQSTRPEDGRKAAIAASVTVKLALLAALVGACTFDSPGAVAPGADDVEDPPIADVPAEPGELRGVWITRFAYADRAGLEGIIDRAAAAGFNAAFVQIRGEGDAYYQSAHEPWARRLTGVLGRTPTWDPLRVAIDRAHSHGMELHAYFNVFSGWAAGQLVPYAEGPVQHPLYANPSWLAVDSTGYSRDTEYQWLAPGNPAVRAHISAVARDLLSRYDVDGLHLDRIRTPGPDYSRDAATTSAYNAARAGNPQLSWGDFMRSQVSAMVAELYAVVGQTRPAARLSASVWGIYQPLPGCATSQGYANYYQDSLAWAAAKQIDALVPMIYWGIEPGACTDWSKLLDGFLDRRAGRHVWAGMHAHDDGTWQFDEVRARIDRARTAGAEGTVVFASSYLDAGPARWDAYVGTEPAPGPFREPAAPPAMAWKP